MKNRMKFYLVDVFVSDKKYSGNQLAVFIVNNPVSDSEMQDIAKEMNFSESIFLMSKDNTYHVRIFTPNEEIPFAGHPLLGAAFVLQQNEKITFPINLMTQSGKVTINYNNSSQTYWLKQGSPSFGRTVSPEIMSAVLGLEAHDIRRDFPVQETSTGLPVFVVPIKSLDAVKSIKMNKVNYETLISRNEAKAICVFTTEVCETNHDIHVRDFAPYYGIEEDPATGSSNGSILAYLVHHQFFGTSNLELISEQGYEIKRPSLLYLKSKEEKEQIDLFVGGKVNPVAIGEWG